MGDTLPLHEEGACLGRSVTSWTSGSGLSPACSRARRWRRCAPSSGSPARPATRSSTATRTAASQALTDRSRRPYRQANQLPVPIEATIVRLKREYPGWGAPKIREKLRQQFTGVAAAGDQHRPCGARSPRPGARAGAGGARRADGHGAVAADRAERAVVRRLQGRVHARRSALLLSADDHRLRQPLSADAARRCRPRRRNTPSRSSSAPSRNSACRRRSAPTTACPSPRPTRSTASASCRCGGCASGFRSSASSPGHPQQNGRHERMHLTLKKEATKPAARQRAAAAGALRCLRRRASTSERPHQALGDEGARRALHARHRASIAASRSSTYPFHDATVTVTHCGRICFNGRKINLSHVFAGQNVGVTQVGERIWLVTFMHYDLGYFDDETCRLEPIENPFGPKVLPMSPE